MNQPAHTHIMLPIALMALVFEHLNAQPAHASRHLLNALDAEALTVVAAPVAPEDIDAALPVMPVGDAVDKPPAVKRTYKPRAPKVAPAASPAGDGAEGQTAAAGTSA